MPTGASHNTYIGNLYLIFSMVPKKEVWSWSYLFSYWNCIDFSVCNMEKATWFCLVSQNKICIYLAPVQSVSTFYEVENFSVSVALQPTPFPSHVEFLLPGQSPCITNGTEDRLLYLDRLNKKALTSEGQTPDLSACETNNLLTLRLNPQLPNMTQSYPITSIFVNSLGPSSLNWSFSQRSRPFAEILAIGTPAVNKQKQCVNVNTFSEVNLRKSIF